MGERGGGGRGREGGMGDIRTERKGGEEGEETVKDRAKERGERERGTKKGKMGRKGRGRNEGRKIIFQLLTHLSDIFCTDRRKGQGSVH
jgi:hypothetical protein